MPFDDVTAMILLAASMVIRRHEWPIILGVIASDRPWRNKDFAELGVDKADVSRAIARLLRDRVVIRTGDRLRFNPNLDEWEGGRELVKDQLAHLKCLVDDSPTSPAHARGGEIGNSPTSPAQGGDSGKSAASSSISDAIRSSSASRSRKKDDAQVGKKPTRPAKSGKMAGVGKKPTGRKLSARGLEFAKWLKDEMRKRGGVVKPDFHLRGASESEAMFRAGATMEEMKACALDLLDDGKTVVDSVSTVCRLLAPWQMHKKNGRRWPRGGQSRRPAIVGGDSGGRASIAPVTRGPKTTAADLS